MNDIRHNLDEKEITYHEVAASTCVSIYMDPKFVCSGGPALWVTLSDDIQPWHPFYGPSLHAFLAFDADDKLESVTVALQGGDR